MMQDIYAHATSVFVWLGKHDGTTKAAVDTVKVLADDCCSWEGKARRNIRQIGNLRDEQKIGLLNWEAPPPEGCDWNAFYHLLSRRWFTRLWVVQEVIHAKRIECFCGGYQIPWDILGKAVSWTSQKHFESFCVDKSSPDYQSEVWIRMGCIDGVFALIDSPFNENVFDDVLCLNFALQASNPFDRVYALLGLKEYADAAGLHLCETISVDYEQCLMDVYAQATYLAIFHSATLEPLHMLGSRSLEPDWPSWIPRFDQLGSFTRTSYALTISRLNESPHGGNACCDIPLSCSRSADGRVLNVEGFCIGRIATVLSLSVLEDLTESDLEYYEAICQAMAYAWCGGLGGSTLDEQTVVKKVLAQLAEYLQHNLGTGLRFWSCDVPIQVFAAFLSAVVKHGPWSCDAQLLHLLELAGSEKGDGRACLPWLLAVVQTLKISAIVHLEHGGFAFCVGGAQVGDELCILFGGNVVYALGNTNGRYRMRGFLDVPGLMSVTVTVME